MGKSQRPFLGGGGDAHLARWMHETDLDDERSRHRCRRGGRPDDGDACRERHGDRCIGDGRRGSPELGAGLSLDPHARGRTARSDDHDVTARPGPPEIVGLAEKTSGIRGRSPELGALEAMPPRQLRCRLPQGVGRPRSRPAAIATGDPSRIEHRRDGQEWAERREPEHGRRAGHLPEDDGARDGDDHRPQREGRACRLGLGRRQTDGIVERCRGMHAAQSTRGDAAAAAPQRSAWKAAVSRHPGRNRPRWRNLEHGRRARSPSRCRGRRSRAPPSSSPTRRRPGRGSRAGSAGCRSR